MWRIAIHMMNLSARRIPWFVGNFLTFGPCGKRTTKTYRYLRTYIHNMNPLNRPSKWNGTPSPNSSQQTSKSNWQILHLQPHRVRKQLEIVPAESTFACRQKSASRCHAKSLSPAERASDGCFTSVGFPLGFLAVSMRYRIGKKKGDDRWLIYQMHPGRLT